MLLTERITTLPARLISSLLIITLTNLYMSSAWAETNFQKAVREGNAYSESLVSDMPTLNETYSDGNIMVDGEAMFTTEQAIGQQEGDYVAGRTDTYGDDSAIITSGNTAQKIYESHEPVTNAEKAYYMVKKSAETIKPDMSNDPLWNNTDNILDNLAEIEKGFSECHIEKQLLASGESIHVPKYKMCSKIPVLEGIVTVGHDYKVGIVKHKSGPVNLASCGAGCMKVWLGTIGDNYWSGSCKIYEEAMSLEILQPDAILNATLEYSKFDDYHQVWLNGSKVYGAPYGDTFPPETAGKCELNKSRQTYPNIDVTSYFTSIEEDGELPLQTRTSVTGGGEGYSRIQIRYDQTKKVYDEIWTDTEEIEKVKVIQRQLEDGFCTGYVQCADMPTLDSHGCATVNGVYICESDFETSPLDGISPFCKRVESVSNCGFNEGTICTTNMKGEVHCFNNDTVNTNTCEQYEEDETCSFVKSECLDSMAGKSGTCYAQEDTYDCGFDANTGTESVQEVIMCDGELQCVGENCYSAKKDGANGDFGKISAYLEMLKYAQSDMTCTGISDAPYDEENPPSVYNPVPSCDAGGTYDSELDLCVGEKVCSFDQANYYAVDLRAGVQIVQDDTTLFESVASPSCTTKIGESVYTCGESRQKTGTDVFYEVCSATNYGAGSGGACPDDAHEYNEETGLCEVIPISSCPDGYDLIEGNNSKSTEDDFCQLVYKPAYTCNDSNDTYNPETHFCENETYSEATCGKETEVLSHGFCTELVVSTPICEEGVFVDGACVVNEEVLPIIDCPSGFKLGENGDFCFKAGSEECDGTATDKWCPVAMPANQKKANSFTAVYKGVNGTIFYAKYGYGQRSPSKYKTGDIIPTTNSRYEDNGDFYLGEVEYAAKSYVRCGMHKEAWSLRTKWKVCHITTLKEDIIETCPTGSVKNTRPNGELTGEEWCYYEKSSPATCERGSTYDSDLKMCVRYNLTKPICVSGMTFNDDTNSCSVLKQSPFELSCIGDAVYDSSTETCISTKSASRDCPVGYPTWDEENQRCKATLIPTIAKVDIKNSNISLMDELLSPFRTMLPDIMPKAYAADNSSLDVTDSMTSYVGSQLTTAKAEGDLTASLTSSTNTDENVECELFKGVANECKIAVGGMQDCCESPVPVSLGDYISLTEHMLAADSLVASSGYIEGYAGVWNTASNYVGDAAASAWDGVSGLWATSGDAATAAVAGEGTGAAAAGAAEGAGEGAVASFTTVMMEGSNAFLKEQFGPEVAQMFFQETTTTAGATTVGPSAGMAAVGSALMVIYYAYLAYVIFNLLIGIIFECTDEEMDLAMKVELLSTHYLGTYCKTDSFLGCIEKRRSYCQFDSPLSRIMMEEIYKQPQMGLSWGTAKHPQCSGLAITDVGKVDWDNVNLDEWVGILIGTGNYTDSNGINGGAGINLDTLTGTGSWMDKLNGEDGEDRKNVLEVNEERFEDFDVDEANRAGYEDKWGQVNK